MTGAAGSMPDRFGVSSGAFRGDRVVVRYRLGDATPADWRDTPNPRPAPGRPSLSDVTGFLLDDGDPIRLERDGVVESIPRSAITSMRLLSAVAVRNSDIRTLEHAAALAWPGIEHEEIDGWLLRAGGGISRRANSAIAVDRSARVDAQMLSVIEDWYAARGLRTLIAVPDRLLPRQIVGVPASDEIQVLTRTLDDVPADGGVPTGGGDVTLGADPSRAWLRAYLGDEADLTVGAGVLNNVAGENGSVVFASVEYDGEPIAIGRGAVTEAPGSRRWLGVTAVWTDPDHRRRHLGDAIVSRLLSWGVQHGADAAYVQAEAGNRVAGTWYRSRGFALHHSYHYLALGDGGRAT
ncbi:GNAT family N-acetyltransferase [Gordonia sp. VNQ95]|uniref:N-acetylglutamate synthase, CG3035 family n=1 Tax=Gordonia sp. VNQ95 TaxID=3156619 RepID=UPI0032B5365D